MDIWPRSVREHWRWCGRRYFGGMLAGLGIGLCLDLGPCWPENPLWKAGIAFVLLLAGCFVTGTPPPVSGTSE